MRSCDRHEVPSVVLVPLGLPWLAYLGLPQPINNQVVNPHGCPRTLPEKRGKTNEKHSPGDSYHTRGPHTIDSSKACTKIIDKLSMTETIISITISALNFYFLNLNLLYLTYLSFGIDFSSQKHRQEERLD